MNDEERAECRRQILEAYDVSEEALSTHDSFFHPGPVRVVSETTQIGLIVGGRIVWETVEPQEEAPMGVNDNVLAAKNGLNATNRLLEALIDEQRRTNELLTQLVMRSA